jgi:hypothetical protein
MDISEKDEAGCVFIYDTKTGVQVFSPQLPKGFLRGLCFNQAAMAVGNRLYMLESPGSEYYYKYLDEDLCPLGLHCLTADRGGDHDEFWNWRPLSPSFSLCWWSDNDNLLMLLLDFV